MRFWIKKENDANLVEEWENSYILTINRDTASTIYSNLSTAWYRMGRMCIDPVYEDLYMIGLAIFALDKRVSRRLFQDCWTREISVSIPVLCYDKWNLVEEQWNKLLSYLTGDKWNIVFRKTDVVYSRREHPSRKIIDIKGCDCVSLFSGGLDSYCGAIKLLEDGKSPVLVGHNEYPKLRYIQEEFCKNFKESYPDSNPVFVGFTAGARAPITKLGQKLTGTENTSRGRSLLFLCAAITIAGIIGKDTPVYIPENGFIGLNVALTNGRKGSCSTRTTHPYFLQGLGEILSSVGIHNSICNFFAYKTKREIVNMVSSTPVFLRGYFKTISCSHPCVSRYNKKGSREYPVNCGYCYPCLIRKAALQDVCVSSAFEGELSQAEYIEQNAGNDKSNDFYAVLSSIYRFSKSSNREIRRLIKGTGKLSLLQIDYFERVYKEGMEDLVSFFEKDPRMEKYLKWKD